MILIRFSHRDCLSDYGVVTSGEAFKTSGVGVMHFSVSWLQVYLNGNWIPRPLPWCSTSHKHFSSEWQSVRPSACPLLIEHIMRMMTKRLWILLIFLRPRKMWRDGLTANVRSSWLKCTPRQGSFFLSFFSVGSSSS